MVPAAHDVMIRLAVPEIEEEDIEAVARVLRSGFLVQGPYVAEFEQTVADYVGVRHAIAVSSGTAALHLALLALGIGPGDEVLVPDFTYPATAHVVELVGAAPVLVDIDLRTFNVDVECLEAALAPSVRAIMPVHLFGRPADMDAILSLAQRHAVHVIEDAACALGAEYRGRKCGTLSDIACFSFHARKVITTGEGGMVATDDDEIAERVRMLRNHGLAPTGGHFQLAGLNYRMTDFQGALGTVQMRRLERLIERRADLAALYGTMLREVDGVICPEVTPEGRSIWQSYVVLLPEGADRDAVRNRLRGRGIETTLGTYAISAQPRRRAAPFPLRRSRCAFERSLSLPLHVRLSPDDVGRVVDELARALG